MRYSSRGLRRRGDTDKWEVTLSHRDPLSGEIVRSFHTVKARTEKQAQKTGVNESGKFSAEGVPITKHGSPYLRRLLWLAANRARQYDPRLKEYYDKLRRKGKPHRVAVTALSVSGPSGTMNTPMPNCGISIPLLSFTYVWFSRDMSHPFVRACFLTKLSLRTGMRLNGRL